MSELQSMAVATLQRWRDDPVAFVEEAFDAEPDPFQLDILGRFPTSPQQAIVGSKGCGKTALLAWLILNFLATRPMANIAVTSISGDNLKDGLWKELALWIQKSPILSAAFEWQSSRIVSRTHPATWWVSARQWSKSADAQQQSQTLAGLHADYTMFVIDEAGSVPQAVAVTAQAALASGIECHLVIGGNPTSLTGPLYSAAVTHRAHWHVVRASGDPDDPKRATRVDLTWARDQIAMFGRESPWVKVNVLGDFPEASLNALLGVEDVTAAMERKLRPESYDWSQKRIGIDASRFGGDLTVLFPRQGLAAFKPRVMRHARGSAVSTDIAAAVMAAKSKWGSELELFDGTGGWSAGAVDVLRAGGVHPIDVQFHSKALDPRYANRRAEMYFSLATWVTSGGALPNVPELVAELTEPTYTFSKGAFLLEDKDLIRARIGRSPGYADALALTFGLPDMPRATMMSGSSGTGKCIIDADPYER